MKGGHFSLVGLTGLLAACQTTLPGEGSCRAEKAQAFVGRTATTTLAHEAMQLTGARIFQWIPPDTIVTTDYRPIRLRITYDYAMIVREIRCG